MSHSVTASPSKVIDRRTNKEVDACEPSEGLLWRAYGSVLGRMLLMPLTSTSIASALWGLAMRSRLSKRRIPHFVEEHGIDMTYYPPVSSYGSFAEFFSRPKVRPPEPFDDDGVLVSPSDSRILAVPIDDSGHFSVVAKGTRYTIDQLMGIGCRPRFTHRRATCPMPRHMAFMQNVFANGHCLVCRLSLTDWHHFLFPCSGRLLRSWHVDGELHSVRQVADGSRPYSMNRRHVSMLSAGTTAPPSCVLLMVEVGAMLVGDIEQEPVTIGDTFLAAQEKGHFALGGSTVILICPSCVTIAEDILRNSRHGNETLVMAGDIIGQVEPGTS